MTYSSNDVESVLEQLVQTHSQLDRGAHFRIVEAGSVYMVVPTDVRDATGKRSATSSPFDVHVTIPAKNLTRFDLLSDLMDVAGAAAKEDIVIINGPSPGQEGAPTYELRAKDEPVRNVLLRVLREMEPVYGPTGWALLYDPQTGKYFMNFNGMTPKPLKNVVPEHYGSWSAPAN